MSDRRKAAPSWNKNNTQADDRKARETTEEPRWGKYIEIEGMSSVTFEKAGVDYDNEE